MPQRAATIVSLPMAFEVVKAMQGDNLEWGEDYRPLARQALAEIIEGEMVAAVDRYLDQLGIADEPDRRNGYYPRREPGRQDTRCDGLSFPPPVTQEPLQGADA